MEIINPLVNQIIVMFLYIAAGFGLFKLKVLSKEGNTNLAGLLVRLILPAVILNSYCVEPTKDKAIGVLLSMVAAILALLLAIVVSRLIFKNRPIDHFAAAFSNAGFVGIPLISATLGGDAVIYITSFVAFLSALQWIYGVAVINEEKMVFTAKTLLNPLVICPILGMILFFTGWGVVLPGAIRSTVSGIAAINAPIAMLVMGANLAQTDFRSLWNDKRLYQLSLTRLVLIPLLTAILLIGIHLLLPAFNQTIVTAVLIGVIAPVGANVAVFAQLYHRDYVYASKTVVVSTLLSLVTIPLVTMLTQIVLGLL